MQSKPELKWTRDIIQLFPACKRAFVQTRMLLAALLLTGVLSSQFPVGNTFRYLFLCGEVVLSVPLAVAVVMQVWTSHSGTLESSPFRFTKATFARLTALQFAYVALSLPIAIPMLCIKHLIAHDKPHHTAGWIIVVALSLVVLTPLIWWGLKSSLAFVLVCLEDAGMFASLRESHRRLNGRFWLVFGYLVPPYLFLGLPTFAFYGWAHKWFEATHGQVHPSSIELAGSSIAYLFAMAADWVIPMAATYPLLVQLYAHVQDSND